MTITETGEVATIIHDTECWRRHLACAVAYIEWLLVDKARRELLSAVLEKERDAWRARHESFKELVRRHNDGISAAILKEEAIKP